MQALEGSCACAPAARRELHPKVAAAVTWRALSVGHRFYGESSSRFLLEGQQLRPMS